MHCTSLWQRALIIATFLYFSVHSVQAQTAQNAAAAKSPTVIVMPTHLSLALKDQWLSLAIADLVTQSVNEQRAWYIVRDQTLVRLIANICPSLDFACLASLQLQQKSQNIGRAVGADLRIESKLEKRSNRIFLKLRANQEKWTSTELKTGIAKTSAVQKEWASEITAATHQFILNLDKSTVLALRNTINKNAAVDPEHVTLRADSEQWMALSSRLRAEWVAIVKGESILLDAITAQSDQALVSPVVNSQIGWKALMAGNGALAQLAFTEGLKKARADSNLTIDLLAGQAVLQGAIGETEKSNLQLRQILAKSPSLIELYEVLANGLTTQYKDSPNKKSDLLKFAQQWQAALLSVRLKDPTSIDSSLALGKWLYETVDDDEATGAWMGQAIEKTIKFFASNIKTPTSSNTFDPKFIKEQQARLSESYLLLARAQLSLKQNDFAIASLNKSLELSIASRGEFNARSAVVLLKLNEAHLAKTNLSTALPYLERALIAREKALGLKHPDTLYTAASLGFAFIQLKQFDKAIAPLNRAVSDAQGLTATEQAIKPEDLSVWWYNLAVSYRNLKQWAEAARAWGQLSERLRVNSQKNAETMQELFDAIDEQADALLAAKLYEKAVPVLEEVLVLRERFVTNKEQEINTAATLFREQKSTPDDAALLEKSLADRKANVATTLVDLVRSLDGSGQLANAETYAKRAYQLRLELFGPDHRLVDIASQWWASVLSLNGQSLQLLALRQSQLSYGLKNTQLKPADQMQRFGSVVCAYRTNKQFKEALAVIVQASTFANQLIEKSDNTASGSEKQTLRRLLADVAFYKGEIERDQDQTEAAFRSFSESIRLYEASLVWQDPETQNARETYAAILDGVGQKQSALEQWQLVLKAVQARQPKPEFDESRVQIELGSLQVAVAGPNAQTAELGLALIRQAIATRTRLFGEQSNEAATAYNNYGVALDVLGRSEQAIAMYEKTLGIALKNRGPDDRRTLITAGNLALAIALVQPNRALNLARDTLERRQKLLPADHPEILNSMGVLAQTYFANGNYFGAAKLHETTANIYQTLGGQNYLDVANNRIQQGRSLLQLGQYREALVVFEDMLRVNSSKEQGLEVTRPFSFEAQTISALDGVAQAKLALGDTAATVQRRQELLIRSIKQYGEKSTATAIERRKLAEAFADIGDYATAFKEVKSAVELCEQTVGPAHPTSLASRAIQVRILGLNGDDTQSLVIAQQVLDGQLRLRGNKHPDVAAAFNNLANVNFNLGRYSVSAQLFEKAFEVNRDLQGEDHPESLVQLSNLAFALDRVGQYQRALELQQQVLTKRREIFGDNHPTIAQSRESIIETLDSLGRYTDSLKLARENYNFRIQLVGAEHPDTLRSMQTLADQLQIQDDYLGAVALLKSRLDIAIRTLGENHPVTLTGFSALARATACAGDLEQSVAIAQRGFNLATTRYGRTSINTIGLMVDLANRFSDQGRYDLEAPLREKIYTAQLARYGDQHPTMASELSSYAAFKNRLGRADLALKAHEQALAIRKQTLGVNHPDYALSLSNVAIMHAQLDDYKKAQLLLEEALVIYRRVYGSQSTQTASIVGDLGTMIRLQGQPLTALPFVQETVSVNEAVFGPTHPNVGSALNVLAVTQEAAGQRIPAIASYQRALALTNDNTNPELRARLLSNLSNVYANNGDLDLSIFFGKLSVNLAQTLRSRLVDLDQKTQRGYIENKDLIYRNLANRLIDAGRIAEAQQVLDMLKKEELYDFIRRDAATDPRKSKLSFSGPEQRFASLLSQAWEQIANADLQLAKLVAQSNAANAAKIMQQQEAGSAARAVLAKTIENITKELPESQRQLIELAKQQQTDLTAKTQEVIASLGNNVALVHYLMLGNKLRILVTSAGAQTVHDVNITERDLNRLIIAARRAIENPRVNPLPAARALNAILIAPIAQRIASTPALMLALDSTLRYVPFGALHDGNRYLVESHQLALYTAASRETIATKPQAKWQVAGLGMTQAAQGFSALPGVREELDSIVGSENTLIGEVHFDSAFTAKRMQSSLKTRYPVLHIASHFKFNPGTETESFLLLGDGGKLSLRDIRVGDYNFSGLDLLTLSACETAMLGGRDDTGKEVEGLGALAQSKGARSVLATLWPIADRSTALLMRDLYYQREQQGIDKSQALRRAQLGLLNGQLAVEVKQNDERGAARVTGAATAGSNNTVASNYTANPKAPFAHPYYWAPFILMGNPL